MTPINFLNFPLVIHPLFKGQRSVGNVRRRFGREKTEQRCARETTYSCANQSDQSAPIKRSSSPIGALCHEVRLGGKLASALELSGGEISADATVAKSPPTERIVKPNKRRGLGNQHSEGLLSRIGGSSVNGGDGACDDADSFYAYPA
jgi:hypothetical protein